MTVFYLQFPSAAHPPLSDFCTFRVSLSLSLSCESVNIFTLFVQRIYSADERQERVCERTLTLTLTGERESG